MRAFCDVDCCAQPILPHAAFHSTAPSRHGICLLRTSRDIILHMMYTPALSTCTACRYTTFLHVFNLMLHAHEACPCTALRASPKWGGSLRVSHRSCGTCCLSKYQVAAPARMMALPPLKGLFRQPPRQACREQHITAGAESACDHAAPPAAQHLCPAASHAAAALQGPALTLLACRRLPTFRAAEAPAGTWARQAPRGI
jgi:hypothetical protein